MNAEAPCRRPNKIILLPRPWLDVPVTAVRDSVQASPQAFDRASNIYVCGKICCSDAQTRTLGYWHQLTTLPM